VVYNATMSRGTNPSFTAGANGVNALLTIEDQKDIIAVATEKSVVLQMAKRQNMGTQLRDMPVMATKPTAYFVNGDNGLKQTTFMAWKNIRLTAEEIAVLIPIPLNVLADANMNVWDKIKPEAGEAIARALDAAILFGTNKPSSWAAALAVQAITAGNTVTQGAGADIAADINNVIAAVEADGFAPSGIAMRQSLRASLRGLRSTTNEFIFKPGEPGAENSAFGSGAGARKGQIFDIPAMTTLSGIWEDEDTASANAAELLVADWDQVVVGVRQDVQVDFSKDASIFDASGALQYNAFQQDGMIARFTARFAYAVPNPTTRMNGTESTRWPAAVLRMTA
jgi:HK97 family phage major capsid protein